MEFKHTSVLLNEVIENLNIKEDGIYIDGTLGGAGHSSEILKRLKRGTLIGIDKDIEALKVSKERLEKINDLKSENEKTKLIFVNDDFKNIVEIIKKENIEKVDGILLDLGVSSYQIDNPERGFSYIHDGILDMRMDKSKTLDAKYIINNYTEEELTKIFKEYGEEEKARLIAKRIVENREEKEITTTLELVDIIDRAKGFNKKGGHNAKKVFQALRIEVNGELNNLEETVRNLVHSLNKDGVLLIITFHSLEDKIVKKTMVELEGKCTCPPDFPVCVCNFKSYGKLIKGKKIKPSKEEMEENKRARSAILRGFIHN